MTAPIKSINVEEIIFYVDLTTDYVQEDILIKQIKNFIENKKKLNKSSSYGLVLFQEDDNPICLYDEMTYEKIIKVIKEKWDTRSKNLSYIENAIFEMLSYIFMKSRTINKVYRIIIISDTPSKRSDEYHQAVYDLIMKSKKFDTIIDIIRVGKEEYYDDDVKIKVITSETQGGAFYCNINQFSEVFGSLIKSKMDFNIIRGREEGGEILEEDKEFYEKLAVDLITLNPDEEEICDICQFELCPICGAYSDEIHKCFNCSAKFHNCCIAHYSVSNNIGFKHIFRCPKCQSLLKLDEDFVELIYEEILEESPDKLQEPQIIEENNISNNREEEVIFEQKLEKISQQAQIIENTFDSEESFNQEESIKEIKIDLQSLPPPPPLKKVKIGGFFGTEVEVKQLTKNNQKPMKIIEFPKVEEPILEEQKSITQLKPPKKRTNIKFCKICGASVKNTITCPNCGAHID